MSKYMILLMLIGVVCRSGYTNSVNDYIRDFDKTRYKVILKQGVEEGRGGDLSNLNAAIKGLKVLNEQFNENVACNTIKSTLSNQNLTIDQLYYASDCLSQLSSACHQVKLNNHHIKIAEDILNKKERGGGGGGSISDIHYALAVLKHSKVPIRNQQTIIETIQAILKTDDTVPNLAHTFFAASYLENNGGKFAYDRIEDCLMQADEVDNRMLQFDNGLTVTSMVLNGIVRLSKTLSKPIAPPLTKQQLEKFSRYLLSRRTVQTLKGVSVLLNVLNTLVAELKDLSVPSVTIEKQHQASLIVFKVCDLLGNPLQLKNIVADSVTRVDTNLVVLSKQALQPVQATPSNTLYQLKLSSKDITGGFYKVVINIDGSNEAKLRVIVKSECAIEALSIGMFDSDYTMSKVKSIEYPNRLDEIIEPDAQQILFIHYQLGERTTKKAVRVQQAFVSFTNVQTNEQIIFLSNYESAPTDKTNHKFILDIDAKASEFAYKSGEYLVDLIIGDSICSNSIKWHLGKVNFKFIKAAAATTTTSVKKPSQQPPVEALKIRQRQALPEIRHQFRPAESRPPHPVSMLFTGLALAPIALLLILWAKLGAFKTVAWLSLNSVMYHICLLSIFVLYYLFWTQLNMFHTCKYLSILATIAFFFGNRLLKSINNQKSSSNTSVQKKK